jgi:hypothetical protein
LREFGRHARGISRAGCSAVKHGPADVVSEALVVEDEFADCVGELVSLPLALALSGAFHIATRHGGADGLDRVGGGS